MRYTVDALRGDLPARYAHLFGDGGFRYLMDEGVHYTNAHYQHANTETIVGHVSLATGTVPAAHGMVGNVWFDRELIHAKGLDQAEVEQAVAEELVKFDLDVNMRLYSPDLEKFKSWTAPKAKKL
jgi:predicted AlkP superfamily pyrophosphatase or phosphodiesterase